MISYVYYIYCIYRYIYILYVTFTYMSGELVVINYTHTYTPMHDFSLRWDSNPCRPPAANTVVPTKTQHVTTRHGLHITYRISSYHLSHHITSYTFKCNLNLYKQSYIVQNLCLGGKQTSRRC